MHDERTRIAVLELAKKGFGSRRIAGALGISRSAVRDIQKSGQAAVPDVERAEKGEPFRDEILVLFARCKGNLVRVHEELCAQGASLSYQALTAFCRRHDIGRAPKLPAGRYTFAPGEEMQHDTSPHTVAIGTSRRPLHCASLVLCYSRLIYAQLYPRWSRFECKIFLTEALRYFDGVAERCMIDNSSVILARGSGKSAVVAPEMEAFAERFGFRFVAHEIGDANRSARVERPFHYIEHNFYPGRSFESLSDANTQLRAWCESKNRSPKRSLHGGTPFELFAAEKPALRRLPLFVPEVYLVHQRRADVDGFISLHTNHYSVPAAVIGRALIARESDTRVRLFDGHALLGDHPRLEHGAHQTSVLPEHRQHTRRKREPLPPLPEETLLRAVSADLGAFVDRLRAYHGGQAVRAVRQLHRFYLDYPLPVLLDTVAEASRYGLLDLGRIERMILRRIAGSFFRLTTDNGDDEGDDE